jgi:hypothetical protein
MRHGGQICLAEPGCSVLIWILTLCLPPEQYIWNSDPMDDFWGSGISMVTSIKYYKPGIYMG